MRIIYDDLGEFAEVVIRCNDTVKKNKCGYCPFYDRCMCDIEDIDGRHIICGKIEERMRSENGN